VSKRDAQQVTLALMALTDAREALADDQWDALLRALESVQDALTSVEHSPGVPIARAADRLGVSRKTVEDWIKRGALRPVPDLSPAQVEVDSLQRVSRALGDLRRRGQDRDWLQALVDHFDDRRTQRSPALCEGVEQLRDGDLEPA
jgi:hypothetical protein